VTDLYCRDADHFPTKTGHVVTLVLHWTFPENCAAYFLVYYQTLYDEPDTNVSNSGQFVYLGATHANLYKVCRLNVPALTQRLEFKVQPVHATGLMLPISRLPSIMYSMNK